MVKVTAVFLSLYLQNGSGSSGKQKIDRASLFTHRWSSHRTRFKEEAHLQYKNIVQQFSCHSKHSYLSVNGPVTSAAIQKNKQTPTQHNLLPKAKIRGGTDHIGGLQVLAH